MVEEMDMATSMTAPRAEIRIPAKSSSPILTSVCWQTDSSSSIVLTLEPPTSATAPKSQAETPASTTPATVPRTEQRVLAVKPPIRYMVTSVVTSVISTAEKKGEMPL